MAFSRRKRAVIINEFDLPTDARAPAGETLHVGVTIPLVRKAILAILLGVAGLVLLARGFSLQIVRGAEFRSRAEGNRIKTIQIPAPRGVILDARGAVLAKNIPSFSLIFIPSELPRDQTARGEALAQIAAVSEVSFEELASVTATRAVKTDLSHEDALRLMLAVRNISGAQVIADAARTYPAVGNGESWGHLLGYVARSTGIGAQGIESLFDERLRGTPGEQRVEVDSGGRVGRVVTSDDPKPGERITLTIDAELEKTAEEILSRHLRAHGLHRGAVIIMDPEGGAVRALVQLPGFDPNAFSRKLDGTTYRALVDDPNRPLFPRATAGAYPSGSTIKPFLAAAALETGAITPATSFLSTGGITYAGRWFFPDWKTGGHGITNLTKAIAESVNTYFYRVGEIMGPEKMAEWLTRFGLGESPGLMPTPGWKRKTRGEDWFIGDTYHMAIGQGDVLVTPLQLANALCALINGGTLYEPRFDESAPPVVKNKIPLTPATLSAIKTAMRATVTVGVAQSLGSLPFLVAGKTGTAEWRDGKLPHAWFEGYAPENHPKTVILVLMEEGGEGSIVAVPVAREILAWMNLTGRLAQ